MARVIDLQAAAYVAAKARRDELATIVSEASKRWNAIKGNGSGPMGLTPDAVKFTPEWVQARSAYWRAHRDLAAHNIGFLQTFKAELREERRQRGR